MNSLRQIGTGILLAAISIIIVLGGFSLATAEGGPASGADATATYQLIIPPTVPVSPTLTVEITDTPESTATNPLTDTPQVTDTVLALPSITDTPIYYVTQPTSSYVCPVPYGWIPIVVKSSDTLASLAATYQMTSSAIMLGNCLTTEQLQAGSVLYVLPKSVATSYVTAVTCGAPYGWVSYYVVAGDTLYNISVRYRTTVAELQVANCLGSSTNIRVGEILKVPNVATTAPLATSTATPSMTARPTVITVSPTSIPATLTPINVPPTAVPTTAVPPTAVPTTAVPPTAVPSTAVPPSAIPPTAVQQPTAVPPTPTSSSGVGPG
jgi:LysM repeat protein